MGLIAAAINAAQLFRMGAQQQAQAQSVQQSAANGGKRACGATVTGKFRPECGDPFDKGDIQ